MSSQSSNLGSSDEFTLVVRRHRRMAPAQRASTSAPLVQPTVTSAASSLPTELNQQAPSGNSRRARARARKDSSPPPPSAADLAVAVRELADCLASLGLCTAIKRVLHLWMPQARGVGCSCQLVVLALGMGSFSVGGARGSTAVQTAALLLVARLVAEENARLNYRPPQLPHLASFDPAATAEDSAVLRLLEIDVLSDDAGETHAARRCTCEAAAGAVPILAFMPHCDAHLYDAMLRANAENLPQLCIIGNSFSWYHISGNVSRRRGVYDSSGSGGSVGSSVSEEAESKAACPDLVTWSALAVNEGAEAAAAAVAALDAGKIGNLILVEVPLPLEDCNATVERALNATSLHNFMTAAALAPPQPSRLPLPPAAAALLTPPLPLLATSI